MPFRNTFLLRRSSDIDRNKLRSDPKTPRGGATVLVVETDRSELERIGHMLEDWNYQVVRADDGKQALSLVKKVRPALVVTSLELPGLSGVELCQEIKKEEKTADIPCLCVAFPEEMQDREIQTGLFTGEYVAKPVSARRFKRQVDAVLRESRPDKSRGPALKDDSVSQIERYMEEFEQQKITQQRKTGTKKVPKKKVQKKAKPKTVPPKTVRPKTVPPKTVKPVAPPPFVGIEDILEEFGLHSSRDVPDAGGESRPKPKYSELDLVRVELQSLREEEATPVFEPSNLYEESQQFVLESIRKADQEKGPDIQWGKKLGDRLNTSLDTDLELLLKATERSQPFDLSAHCVNVVIFALKIAKTLKCDQATQQRVGLAALLHEIGVIKLPKQLVYKEGMLNAAEVGALRQRPVYSAEILQILGVDYAWLAEIVGQVYERENGSGFPLSLDGNAIVEEAKIIGVADIFEACIHERPYRKALTGYEAVRQLTAEGTKLFSDRIVKALMNSFSLYPYNEYVKLNSGEIGQVVEVNQTNLFRPLVKILYDQQGDPIEEAKTVDLTQNASLFISQAITADELPQSSKLAITREGALARIMHHTG